MKQKTSKLYKKEQIWAYIFVAIPIIGFAVFTVVPFIYSFWYSLTDYNPIRDETRFVNFDNYINLFKDQLFLQSIVNTIVLLASIFIGMMIGLLLAEVLKKPTRRNKWLRIIYYLPAVSSVVAINIVFRYLFNNEFGLINHIFGINIPWLGTGFWPIKIAIIIKNIWASIGATMILYIAGLNQIDETYYEASQIDGANRIQQFFKITVPMIRPITFYLIITGVIGGLQSFADAQLMADGNPEAVTIVYYIWARGIDASRYGVAAAASLILGVTIMIITIFQFRKMDIVQVS